MNRRLILVIALAAAVAVGTAALVLRTSHSTGDSDARPRSGEAVAGASPGEASTALPPQGVPLRTSFARLYGEAASGNPIAAERLFGEAAACLHTATVRESLDHLARRQDWLTTSSGYFEAEGEAGKARQAKLLDEVAQNIQRVEASANACEGTDALLANGRIYEFARVAAEQGDDTAAACLLTPVFPGRHLSDAEGRAYRDDAMRLGKAAIDRGSWQAVEAMLSTYNPPYPAGYEVYLAQIDPAGRLRYTRLLRMGTPDGSQFAQTLDQAIAMLAASVGPEGDDAAREWASQAFQKSFFYSGPPDPSFTSCFHAG
ncbi:hypothetical protein KPL74_05995 [Bacillus sp. NP157]|nr:hypothetical protein KPL74_05995 [Bacillus sp. NP157]